jgi:hypothetical protein
VFDLQSVKTLKNKNTKKKKQVKNFTRINFLAEEEKSANTTLLSLFFSHQQKKKRSRKEALSSDKR